MQTITIVTDAWKPQVNGVVRTYENIQKYGLVDIVNHTSFDFVKIKLPSYKEIDLVLNPWLIEDALYEATNNNHKIHVATEGPLGLFASCYLVGKNYPFTTSFHTNFPAYINKRYKISERITFPFFKWFHSRATATLVPSLQTIDELNHKGFKNLKFWSRGVDTELFNPSKKQNLGDYILCVSRVAHEKGLDDFCMLDYPRKILIGDGPYLSTLKKKYPEVEFLGKLEGEELAKWYASAKCFVFPSKTDTFGIVLLEALASGIPIASYEEPGPLIVIQNNVNGIMAENLQYALNESLKITLDKNIKYNTYTWQNVYDELLKY